MIDDASAVIELVRRYIEDTVKSKSVVIKQTSHKGKKQQGKAGSRTCEILLHHCHEVRKRDVCLTLPNCKKVLRDAFQKQMDYANYLT